MKRQWNTTTRLVVIFICLALTAIVAYEIQPLIVPLIIAALLAYTLNLATTPLTNRTRLGHKWSVNLVYFIFLALVIATPSTLVPMAVRQIQNLSADIQEIEEVIGQVLESPPSILGRPLPLNQLWDDFTNVSTDFGSALDGTLNLLETTSVGILRIVIITVVTYYLLMDWQDLRRWLLNLLTEQGRADSQRLLAEINSIWRAYLQGTLALMIIMAVVFIIIGLAIGLPGAIAVGIMTGLLSMIPEIGPWVSGIIATLIALLAGSHYLPLSNFWFAILVAAIYAVISQIKSIWLRPQVMRRFMHMNTGVVFLAIIGAAMLQGVLAALIILPVLASARVLGRFVRARLLNEDPWPIKEETDPAEEAQTDSSNQVS
jgi:predicted PurR-regulated permease PerM